MTDNDMAAVLAPVERSNSSRHPEDHECPKCDGIGAFPGVDVDGTPCNITCDLCDGNCHVGREVWLDWLADDFADRRPGR